MFSSGTSLARRRAPSISDRFRDDRSNAIVAEIVWMTKVSVRTTRPYPGRSKKIPFGPIVSDHISGVKSNRRVRRSRRVRVRTRLAALVRCAASGGADAGPRSSLDRLTTSTSISASPPRATVLQDSSELGRRCIQFVVKAVESSKKGAT